MTLPPVPPDGDRPASPRGPQAPAHSAVAAALTRRSPRGGVADAQQHTRMVNLAKVALPALAAAVLGLIAVWPLFTGRPDTRRAGPDSGQLEMVDARYLGTDKGARPFEVRAEKVVQVGGGTNLIELVKPQAEITMKGGDWITLSARRGNYDQKSGQLVLEGGVTLFQDGGYEFTTEMAQVDTQKGIAWGNAPVHGQGPTGDIDAGGFRILDDGNTIVFTGKARLLLVDGMGERG